MWNATAEVIPVIRGATETISKTVREQHRGNHEIKKVQKATMLGTEHILRKVLL
jgi:hypothetical protein